MKSTLTCNSLLNNSAFYVSGSNICGVSDSANAQSDSVCFIYRLAFPKFNNEHHQSDWVKLQPTEREQMHTAQFHLSQKLLVSRTTGYS